MYQNFVSKNVCTKISLVEKDTLKCCQEKKRAKVLLVKKVYTKMLLVRKASIKILFFYNDIQSFILWTQILLDFLVIIWIFLVQILIISTLVMAILIKIVLKLLFILEFGYYVTIYGFKQQIDINNIKHFKLSKK